MSNLYLVRHGQAGTRDVYDELSDLGRRQARRLGEYFLAQGTRFASAFSGPMVRQQETAREVSAVLASASVSFPEVMVDPGWGEIGLDRIYEEMAPRLCQDDAEFRREWEKMQEAVRASGGEHAAKVHRRWLPCDTALVNAWMAARYPYSGESWEQFRARVAACRARLDGMERDANVVVFTSAIPAALWVGSCLGVTDGRVMQLAGALYNTSYTVLRVRGELLQLFSFNNAPHLDSPELRTHR